MISVNLGDRKRRSRRPPATDDPAGSGDESCFSCWIVELAKAVHAISTGRSNSFANQPAMRLTEPATMAGPNTYDGWA